MSEVHLIGVQHTNEKETVFIKTIISQVQPDVIFLELGEYRLQLIKDGINLSRFLNRTRGYVFDLNFRGRLVTRTLTTAQMIQAIKSGTLFKSVDMKPAFKIGEQMDIDVIPIDMNQHEIMNKLGTEIININNMQEFTQRFTQRMSEHKSGNLSNRNDFDINNLESLREIANRKKEVVPTYYKVLIEDRNEFMTQNITEEMRQHSTGLAVVGALHTPGLMDKLQAQGFNVEVHL